MQQVFCVCCHMSLKILYLHTLDLYEKLQQTIILALFANKILSKYRNYLSSYYTAIILM